MLYKSAKHLLGVFLLSADGLWTAAGGGRLTGVVREPMLTTSLSLFCIRQALPVAWC